VVEIAAVKTALAYAGLPVRSAPTARDVAAAAGGGRE
jgi:hypothetical protein